MLRMMTWNGGPMKAASTLLFLCVFGCMVSARKSLATPTSLSSGQGAVDKPRQYVIASKDDEDIVKGVLDSGSSGQVNEKWRTSVSEEGHNTFKRECLNHLTNRVFDHISRANPRNFQLDDKTLKALLGSEIAVIEANPSSQEGAECAIRLCSSWGLGRGNEDAWLRGAVGYAIFLRYGNTLAGRAGRKIFEDNLRQLAEGTFAELDSVLSGAGANVRDIADALDKALAARPVKDSRRAWACLYLAEKADHETIRILAKSFIAEWMAANGKHESAVRFYRRLVQSAANVSLTSLLWEKQADCLMSADKPLVAVPFYLAAARVAVKKTLQRTMYERAVELMVQHSREEKALEIVGRDLHYNVASPKLKQFMAEVRAKADDEISSLMAQVQDSSNTDVVLRALGEALDYRAVGGQTVSVACKKIIEIAPHSKEGLRAHLVLAEQLLWREKPIECLKELEGLTVSDVPLDTRVMALELAGDCHRMQGAFLKASARYREASAGYAYENDIGGFGFFRLKRIALSSGSSENAYRIDAECLKSYLLLARGRTSDGIARLNRIFLDLKSISDDAEVHRLRTSDVHFLLAGAYLVQGEREMGCYHGQHALRHVLRTREDGDEGLLSFAELLSRRAAGSPNALVPMGHAAAAREIQGMLNTAERFVEEGRCAEARSTYRQVLGRLRGRDIETVLTVCKGVVESLDNEYGEEELESTLFHFRVWAARFVPREYEGCARLAIANAYYRDKALTKASDEIRDYLWKQDEDEELTTRAELLAGLVHFKSGRPAEAIRIFEDVLARDSTTEELEAQTLFLLGYVNLTSGKADEAERSFRSLTTKYPDTKYAQQCKSLVTRMGTMHSAPSGD